MAIPNGPPCTPSLSWNCLIPGRPGTWQMNSQPLVPTAHALTVILSRCIEDRTSSAVMRGHSPQAYRAFAKGNATTGQYRRDSATQINTEPPSRRSVSLCMRSITKRKRLANDELRFKRHQANPSAIDAFKKRQIVTLLLYSAGMNVKQASAQRCGIQLPPEFGRASRLPCSPRSNQGATPPSALGRRAGSSGSCGHF
jgi:hypothetical protein